MNEDARRQAGLSALVVAVLFGTGSAIWGLDMPRDGTPAPEVVDWYERTADRIVVGASISLLAIGAMAWFAAALRRVLADADRDDVLATTAFGGVVLTMATGVGAETINMAAALRARDGELTEPLAQALFETSQMLGSVAPGVGAGVVALALAAVALRTGQVLSRPAAYAFALGGVVLLSPLSHIAVVPGGLMVVAALVLAATFLRRPLPLPA